MRGISPIVAVVLLIAISVIASVGVWYWVGSLTGKKATPNAPDVIQAQNLGVKEFKVGLSSVGYATEALVQNLGKSTVKSNYIYTTYTQSGLVLITVYNNLEYIPTTLTKIVSGKPYGIICVINIEGGADNEGKRAEIPPNGQVTCKFYNITNYTNAAGFSGNYTINESVGLYTNGTSVAMVNGPILAVGFDPGNYVSSG